jgi:hypothetical protein
MRWFGEVDRNSEAARENAETGDVILMLVGDEDGVERSWIFSRERHAAAKFAA